MNKIYERFLFSHIDPRQYAALRIGVGLLIGISTLRLFGSIDSQLSDLGWLSHASAVGEDIGDPWVFLNAFRSNFATTFVVSAIFLLSISFTLGLMSRLCNILLFILIAALRARNVLITYGGDDLIRLLLFALIWTRSGARWSVDNYLSRSTDSSVAVAWPLRLIQIQICLIYLIAGGTKLLGADWLEGRALGYLLQDQTLTNFDLRIYVFGNQLAPRILSAITKTVPIAELILPFLIWFKKSRRWAIIFGLIFHGLITLFFKVELFSCAMWVGYLSFASNGVLHTLEQLFGDLFKSSSKLAT